MPPARNVSVGGVWYGPDYPEAGDPPADKVDAKFLGRAVDEPVADGDFVGSKAVTEPGEAAQFGSPVLLEKADGDKPTGQVAPAGGKAVDTESESSSRGKRSPRSSRTD